MKHFLLKNKKITRREISFFRTIFIGLICFVQIPNTIFSQEIYFPQDQKMLYSFPKSWTKVSEKNKIDTLRIFVSTVENTPKKISSVSGEYFVQYEEGISPSYAKDLGISENKYTNDLARKIDFTINIHSDLSLNKTFRAINIIKDFYETKGSTVEIKDAISYNKKSILSKAEYIYSIDQERIPIVPELPDFLDAQNKRNAWREPPEITQNTGLVDSIDPSEYYDLKIWGNAAFLLEAMDGKLGDEIQKQALDIIYFFESTDDKGVKWFRLYQQIISKDGKSDFNIFWNEESGLHPVCSLYTNSSHNLKDLIQVRWKKINNVFTPIESLNVVYDDFGKLSYRRKMIANDVNVNQPIDPQKFTFSVLGLEDGDILVDRIKQSVYTIKNNKPVYLAKFYEKYQTPKERGFNRMRFVIMGIGVLLICVGLFVKYRHRKASGSAT